MVARVEIDVVVKKAIGEVFAEHVEGLVRRYLESLPVDDGEDMCLSYREHADVVLNEGYVGQVAGKRGRRYPGFVDWVKAHSIGENDGA